MTALRSLEGSACLVTGGAGFVGQNIVTALVAKGCRVRVLDRVPCPVASPLVTSIVGDLVNADDVHRALEGVDVVFHTAAIIELAERAPKAVKARVRAVNVDATRSLLDASEDAGVTRFVQTSTYATVLAETGAGGDESLPYSRFTDLYCSTKVEAEKLVRGRNGARMKTASLRPGGIYGPGERAQLVMPLFTSLRRGEPLTVLGDGTSRLDYTYIGNLVDAHVRAAERLVDGSPVNGSAYFICDDQPMNHGEMSRRMARAVGYLPRVRHLPAKVLYAVADLAELAYERFDRKPPVTRMQCRTCLFDFHFSCDAAKRDLGLTPISTDEGIALCTPDLVSFVRTL